MPMAEGPGERVGRYKMLQQIGEGGRGTVFMAEQEQPVRRRVALKVIKRGMDTKSVVARPPSTAYRLQKAIRRNKLVFLAGTAVVLALLLGVVGTNLALLRAREAEALAIRSRGEAEKLSSFMLDEFHDELQPSGRFETMARLAQQTLDYYEGLPRSLRTSATELHRLTAQARLASIRVQQGQFKVGDALAQEAADYLYGERYFDGLPSLD